MNAHARARELLPWMINGRIDGDDAAWVNGHLADCAACRTELAAERRIREAITREPTVEFAPQASFNRLWKRIEADAREPTPVAASVAMPVAAPDAAPRVGRRPRPARAILQRWLRVALAAQAAAILVLCGVLWQRPTAAAYRTVTDAPPAPLATGPVVKAIFDDDVRLADVKEILAGSALTVASGPSEGGVYALVARDAHLAPISTATLARLRADPRVRFAELGAQ